MNLEQFNEIVNKLKAWREERGLSVEDQKRNFKVNYTKELLEYYEAERDNNEYEIIDALSDMLILCINAGGVLNKSSCNHYTDDLIYAVTKNTSKESRREILNKINSSLIKPLSESCDSIEYLILSIVSKGYDPYLCLLETIKELESRTGAWNEKEGKWIKDVGAYTEQKAKMIAEKRFKESNKQFSKIDTTNEKYFVAVSEAGDMTFIKKWYKADYSKCKLK